MAGIVDDTCETAVVQIGLAKPELRLSHFDRRLVHRKENLVPVDFQIRRNPDSRITLG
jgi:hypothetical protein